MSSFSRLATLTGSTKRVLMTGGKTATPTAYLSGVVCTPLDPVFDDVKDEMVIETPYRMVQTFVDSGLDIKKGDILTVNGQDYPVHFVSPFEWRSSTFLRLTLEDRSVQ